MMKRTIRMYVEETGDDGWANLLPHLVGNVGLVFTKGDLSDVREQIVSYKVLTHAWLLPSSICK